MRRYSKQIKINKLHIGKDNKIAIQSMLNTLYNDVEAGLSQIKRLVDAGCDVIRFSVPNVASAEAVTVYKNNYPDVAFVADIHFDHKIALACIERGIDKIRINPGNIGSDDGVRAVALAARSAGVPIRIGVNGGSLEKSILGKYGRPTAEAIAESAFYHVSLLQRYDFDDIVISAKSSDVKTTVAANRIIAEGCAYPLHLGVTEAGTKSIGVLKSAVGIGSLLCDGIGDTVRVSLTDDPVEEVLAAKRLLEAIGLSDELITTVSCPTCGRTAIDLINLAERFDEIKHTLKPSRRIKVAIMGCAVNGPGEARECDIGVAGGNNEGLIFKDSKPLKKVPYDKILEVLSEEINKL